MQTRVWQFFLVGAMREHKKKRVGLFFISASAKQMQASANEYSVFIPICHEKTNDEIVCRKQT
jgi:hypothetical protein